MIRLEVTSLLLFLSTIGDSLVLGTISCQCDCFWLGFSSIKVRGQSMSKEKAQYIFSF